MGRFPILCLGHSSSCCFPLLQSLHLFLFIACVPWTIAPLAQQRHLQALIICISGQSAKKKKKKPNLFLEWGENKTWSPFSEKAHHTANLSWCQDAVSSVDGDVPAIEVPAKTHSLFPAAVKWSLQKSKVDHGGSTSTVPCCILAPDISVPGTMCDTTWTSPGSCITLPN